MHSLDEIRREYERLDRLCGVDTSGVEIGISNRTGRRLGSFRYPMKAGAAPLRIVINSALLEQDVKCYNKVVTKVANKIY